MSKNIIIKKSKINKKGVFARRDFKKGDVILKWKPKILRKPEAEKLEDNQRHYLYKVGRNKYFLMQSPEKFVNHSCEANTRVKNNCDVAVRNIEKGEEITSNYGKGGLNSFICKCGSKDCRGVIN
jgi:SET domain-containing protein